MEGGWKRARQPFQLIEKLVSLLLKIRFPLFQAEALNRGGLKEMLFDGVKLFFNSFEFVKDLRERKLFLPENRRGDQQTAEDQSDGSLHRADSSTARIEKAAVIQ